MSEDEAFHELIRRGRGGDREAATELVRRYESAIHVTVRRRLTDPELRHVFDSMDGCQSILASFSKGAAAGRFDLDEPEQPLHLLVTSYARRERAARRDARRLGSGGRATDPGARHPLFFLGQARSG